MQKAKLPTKNYIEFQSFYQLKLPLEIEMLIPEDDSVRLLSQMLEGLNYSKLYQAYSVKGRKPAVDPKVMFKVLTYAYSNGIYTTHKIEQSCKRDINFLWLLAGSKAPDHSTIARFRQKYLAESIDDLYYQMVNQLYYYALATTSISCTPKYNRNGVDNICILLRKLPKNH